VTVRGWINADLLSAEITKAIMREGSDRRTKEMATLRRQRTDVVAFGDDRGQARAHIRTTEEGTGWVNRELLSSFEIRTKTALLKDEVSLTSLQVGRLSRGQTVRVLDAQSGGGSGARVLVQAEGVTVRGSVPTTANSFSFGSPSALSGAQNLGHVPTPAAACGFSITSPSATPTSPAPQNAATSELRALLLSNSFATPEQITSLLAAGAAVNAVDHCGRTTLMNLLISNYHATPQQIEAVLTGGAVVDARDIEGRTALMNLLISNHHATPQQIDALLGAGAVVDTKDHEGKTALMHLAISNHHATPQQIGALLAGGAVADLTDKEGRSALMHLMLSNDQATTQQISTIAVHTDINATDRSGRNVLMMMLAGRCTTELLELVLEQHAVKHGSRAAKPLMEQRDGEGRTALLLLLSSLQSHAPTAVVEMLRILLVRGADITATDHDGRSALMLLLRGWPVARDSGLTALQPKSNSGGATGGGFNFRQPMFVASTAVSTAGQRAADHKARLCSFYAKHNPEKLLTVEKQLTKYKGQEDKMFAALGRKYLGGASVPAHGSSGASGAPPGLWGAGGWIGPPREAAQARTTATDESDELFTEIFSFLVARGADVTTADLSGCTVTMQLCQRPHLLTSSVLECMLTSLPSAHATCSFLDAVDENGCTALMHISRSFTTTTAAAAAAADVVKAVQLLLRSGADVGLRDDKGCSAFGMLVESIESSNETMKGASESKAKKRGLREEGRGADEASRPLAVGDQVKVRLNVQSPRHGWGSVNHSSVGSLMRIHTDGKVTVKFPSQSGWTGRLHEMELVIPEKSARRKAQTRSPGRPPPSPWGSKSSCPSAKEEDVEDPLLSQAEGIAAEACIGLFRVFGDAGVDMRLELAKLCERTGAKMLAAGSGGPACAMSPLLGIMMSALGLDIRSTARSFCSDIASASEGMRLTMQPPASSGMALVSTHPHVLLPLVRLAKAKAEGIAEGIAEGKGESIGEGKGTSRSGKKRAKQTKGDKGLLLLDTRRQPPTGSSNGGMMFDVEATELGGGVSVEALWVSHSTNTQRSVTTEIWVTHQGSQRAASTDESNWKRVFMDSGSHTRNSLRRCVLNEAVEIGAGDTLGFYVFADDSSGISFASRVDDGHTAADECIQIHRGCAMNSKRWSSQNNTGEYEFSGRVEYRQMDSLVVDGGGGDGGGLIIDEGGASMLLLELCKADARPLRQLLTRDPYNMLIRAGASPASVLKYFITGGGWAGTKCSSQKNLKRFKKAAQAVVAAILRQKSAPVVSTDPAEMLPAEMLPARTKSADDAALPEQELGDISTPLQLLVEASGDPSGILRQLLAEEPQTQQQQQPVWDEGWADGMAVSEDGALATMNSGRQGALVRLAAPLVHGGNRVYNFELTFRRPSQGDEGKSLGGCYVLGVATGLATAKPDQRGLKRRAYGGNWWGIEDDGESATGSDLPRSSKNQHGRAFGSGDRVGLRIDMSEGKIEFYRNGERIVGADQSNVPTDGRDGEIYLVACPYNSSANVKVVGGADCFHFRPEDAVVDDTGETNALQDALFAAAGTCSGSSSAGKGILQILRSAGADLDLALLSRLSSAPTTPAAVSSLLMVVEGLVDAGASLEGRDERGRTPLLLACKYHGRQPQVIEALLKRGADAKAQDAQGQDAVGTLFFSFFGKGRKREADSDSDDDDDEQDDVTAYITALTILLPLDGRSLLRQCTIGGADDEDCPVCAEAGRSSATHTLIQTSCCSSLIHYECALRALEWKPAPGEIFTSASLRQKQACPLCRQPHRTPVILASTQYRQFFKAVPDLVNAVLTCNNAPRSAAAEAIDVVQDSHQLFAVCPGPEEEQGKGKGKEKGKAKGRSQARGGTRRHRSRSHGVVHLGDGSCTSRHELEAQPIEEANKIIRHACPQCEEQALLGVIEAAGSFRGGDDVRLKVCPKCGCGPYLFDGCDDMTSHREGKGNSCASCGFFASSISQWATYKAGSK
jgi:ankyrin repeat protein